MNDDVVKQLREASYVKGKQRTWISKLSDNQLLELFLRLRNGENAKIIARHIKKTCKAMSDSSVHSISKGVLKFKKRIKNILEKEIAGSNATPILQPENVNRMRNIELLEYLADRQSRRILAMIEEENETNIRNVNINREIDSLTTFTKAIAKSKALQTELTREEQPDNSRFYENEKSISKDASIQTKTITDEEKKSALFEAVEMVRTLLAINIGTSILGQESKHKLIEKYPSLEKFLFKVSDIVIIP